MDGADLQTEYEYDENGNLTKDLNKKISRITYNLLNLPKEIMFMDGSYIHYTYDAEDLTQFFTDINITEENGIPYLNVMYKGKKPICERILKLDAERYQKGGLPLSNLLSKYCSYIVAGNRE